MDKDKAKTNSPRKQKQLGPAPICSFEKSFEDSSSDELKYKVSSFEVCPDLTFVYIYWNLRVTKIFKFPLFCIQKSLIIIFVKTCSIDLFKKKMLSTENRETS